MTPQAQAEIQMLRERAEAAEKACAEMRTAIKKMVAIDRTGEAYEMWDTLRSNTSGRSYIRIDDPVIVELFYCLNEFTKQCKSAGLTPPQRVTQAIAAYEAIRKECGL